MNLFSKSKWEKSPDTMWYDQFFTADVGIGSGALIVAYKHEQDRDMGDIYTTTIRYVSRKNSQCVEIRRSVLGTNISSDVLPDKIYKNIKLLKALPADMLKEIAPVLYDAEVLEQRNLAKEIQPMAAQA